MAEKIDFIGIGAAKSGTSWLAYLLEQHPEIQLSSRKEVAYFNGKSFDGKPNDTVNFDMDYYHQFWDFTKPGIRGEFSPQYLFDPEACGRIKAYNPEVKLIAILRNPVKRAFSHFRYDQGFNQLISKNLSFSEACLKHPYLLESGMYGKQLKPYFEAFSTGQIKLFFLEEAISNPRDTASELYAFLGVDPEFCPDVSSVNESKQVSNNLLTRVVQTPVRLKQKLESDSKLFRKIIGPIKQQKWYVHLVDRKTKLIEANTEPLVKGELHPSAEAKVKTKFKEDLNLLTSLIGRIPPSWS